MAGALQCAITSPEGLIFEGEAKSVILPAIDGELGIFPRHAPLIGALGVGELRIEPVGGTGVKSRYFLEGGFVQVLKNQVTVLATSAEPLEGADRAAAEAKLKAVTSSPPARSASPEERDAYAAKVQAAKRKLKLSR